MAEGILHVYHPGRHLNLFEHLPYLASSTSRNTPRPPKHVLLFIGGMFDNFSHPHYVNDLAALFPLHDTQEWRVMHVQLSSNGRSWGILDIDRDVEEIATCVDFIRKTLFKDPELDIVLMGHSTGCQDTLRYLTAPNPPGDKRPLRPIVQGAILQAPVSDRDGAIHTTSEGPEAKKGFDAAMEIVKSTAEKDRRDTIIPMNLTKPLFGPVPISVARFISVVSPDSPNNPTTEDFFSQDLSDATLQKTFGSIGRNKLLHRSTGDGPRDTQSILILMSDSDEFAHTNQKQLLSRWKAVMQEHTGAVIHGDSAVILNAIHDVGGMDWPSQEARLVVLRKKILHYLKYVVGGVDHYANEIWHSDGDRVMALKTEDGRKIEDQVGVLKL